MSDSYSSVVNTARDYYNSSDADQFYFNIWGGEDIHIGLYEEKDPEKAKTESIADASHRTVETMASHLPALSSDMKVLDVGAGYGGAARSLARTYGCRVVCLNISEEQNRRNRIMNAEQKLDSLIEVVDGSFENLPFENDSFDVVWSQDAILHSGERKKVLEEIHRVLKKGGQLIFTDPMQKEGVSKEELKPVLDRIHLDTLGSFEFYRATAESIGFEQVGIVDLSPQLTRHYSRVLEEVTRRYDEMIKVSSRGYLDRMKEGLRNWIAAGESEKLRWGILQFRKP